ncbi:hypothetical protein HMPREF9336_03156 [Segniliparus rugosus ATCC BAA-974]|uniref:Uncharacterized protein n=2 Tax=Segniliparus rugosus TaxID=286804 RepID=E5XUI4_SEGRC|nr:hypothetical protein HMPREF9336_03156 [Segniliparus rugosus ATCC BAA-974]
MSRKADIKRPNHADVVVKRRCSDTEWANWLVRAKCRCDLTQQKIAELTGISLYRQRRWVEDGDLPSLEEIRLMAEITGSEYGDLLLLCGYITAQDVARLVRRVSLPGVPSEDLVAEYLRRVKGGAAPSPEWGAAPALPGGEPEIRVDHRELAAVRVEGGELSLCAENADGHDPLVLSKLVSDDGARTEVWFTRRTGQEALGLFKEGLRIVGGWVESREAWATYGTQRIRLGTCTAFSRTLMIYVEFSPDSEPRIISASSSSRSPSSCVEFTQPALAEYVVRLREGLSLLRRWS